MSLNDEFDQDPLSWSMQLEKHFCGEFSMASVQSNLKMEDKGQVEVCNYATFIGIYDGSKGDAAARYLDNYIFADLVGESFSKFFTSSLETLYCSVAQFYA
jgi:type VI protein secretion system component VasK